ncbi:hypothetical protein AVEN_105156-1 [Araneus ventricosus]|uniref:Tc1-like transposase DDE domain-containing protein n=1 Tax=Araneus ventricosus TaxID=182803 RepID=A0A4Y2K3Z3_ARAVE|nr:hypothetical protein AVEN_105156-1 [Araneus ventricosus]
MENDGLVIHECSEKHGKQEKQLLYKLAAQTDSKSLIITVTALSIPLGVYPACIADKTRKRFKNVQTHSEDVHSAQHLRFLHLFRQYVTSPVTARNQSIGQYLSIHKDSFSNLHFGNDRIISRHFPTTWPPRSPHLNPCDFWLRGYLKDVVYGGPILNLAELKNRITQHIYNITTETLQSVLLHAVLRFQLIGENGGQHIEHFLNKSKPTSFS